MCLKLIFPLVLQKVAHYKYDGLEVMFVLTLKKNNDHYYLFNPQILSFEHMHHTQYK